MSETPPINENAKMEWFRLFLLSSVRDEHPDLTMRQLAVLLVTECSTAPLNVKELGDLLKIPHPAVSRSIDRLQNAGLVTRRNSSEDGRKMMIHSIKEKTEFLHQTQGWVETTSEPAGASHLSLVQSAPDAPDTSISSKQGRRQSKRIRKLQ